MVRRGATELGLCDRRRRLLQFHHRRDKHHEHHHHEEDGAWLCGSRCLSQAKCVRICLKALCACAHSIALQGIQDLLDTRPWRPVLANAVEKVVQVGAEQHHRLTRNVRIIDGRKMEVSPEEVSNDATDYSAELWKSTDGGNSWTKLMSDTGNFYFNDIHCYDETNCVAVAEGFGETGGETGARVYRTTDGETFEKVLHKDDTHAESLMTTKMLSASEYWVGGSTKPGGLVAPSLILHSVDAGATHTDESSGIVGQMMTSMDCVSAEHCYATSLTALQTCNLLELGGNNPPAPSPTPTPGVSHYEQPPCQDGEAQASVTGTDGALCAPPCDASGSCPTDVPDGVTAGPQCVLSDQSGNQYCALICSSDDECDTAGGSSCQHPSAGQPGLCVYPTSSANAQLSFLNQAVTV